MLTTLLYRLQTRLPWDKLVVGLASWESHAPGDDSTPNNPLQHDTPTHSLSLSHVCCTSTSQEAVTIRRCVASDVFIAAESPFAHLIKSQPPISSHLQDLTVILSSRLPRTHPTGIPNFTYTDRLPYYQRV